MDAGQTILSATSPPDIVDCVVLTALGKKNWMKLYDTETTTLSKVKDKKCSTCGLQMDYRISGLLLFMPYAIYYQQRCSDCKNKVDNKKVCANPIE